MKLFYVLGHTNQGDGSLLIEAEDVAQAKKLWHDGAAAAGWQRACIWRVFELNPTHDTAGILWCNSEGCKDVTNA